MPVMIPMPGLATLTSDDIPTVETVVKGGPGLPDVRRFSAAALNAQIDDAMKALGSDRVALFARVDLAGAHGVLVGRIPEAVAEKLPGKLSWTVYVDKPWEGDWDAGVGLRWSL